jgi:photosystem II stability/assembly factor-like uncharacterized protein
MTWIVWRSWPCLGFVFACVAVVGAGCAPRDQSADNCGIFANARCAQQVSFCTASHLYSVHFVSASVGWIAGGDKTICKSANGGTTWSIQTPPASLPPGTAFNDVQFVNALTGWIVGSRGTILKTTTGGNTWTAQTSGVTYDLRNVYFVDSSTGWAVGDAETILKTTNGGTTWVRQHASPFPGIRDIYCSGSSTCVLIGPAGGGGATPAKWTINGGQTWQLPFVVFPHPSLLGVHFAGARTGYAVGFSGAIWRANSPTSGWFPVNSGTNATLYSVYCVNTSNCWVVGSGGTILKGPSWTAQNSGTTAILNHVHFVNTNAGWAVGTNGAIRRTTNGGATWF